MPDISSRLPSAFRVIKIIRFSSSSCTRCKKFVQFVQFTGEKFVQFIREKFVQFITRDTLHGTVALKRAILCTILPHSAIEKQYTVLCRDRIALRIEITSDKS